MPSKQWIPPIALEAKPASAIGAWEGPTAYYLRVPTGLGPAVRGGALQWDTERLWYGTTEQIEQALETIRRFIAQPGNEMILDIEIRAHETEPGLEYRKLFDPGGWTDWEFVPLPQGPEGVQGDRYLLYSEREAPNSYATLYRQLQVIDPETGLYVDEGEPEELDAIYDGWVHVGFWWPYAVDNEDGTVTFWRQWYCRDSAEVNEFHPEGDPEEMGTAVLPVGPVGGHYLITSSNPAPHVAFFHREFQTWDPVNEEWVPSEVVEQFGGIEAPQGEQGEDGRVGDYFELLADNPPEQPDTVVLYRQRRHGVTEVTIGSPVEIASAVAIQGEQGIPGIQGAPGASAVPWSPSVELDNSTEWERLSWISHLLATMAATSMESTTRLWSNNLGMSVGTIGAAAAIAGLTAVTGGAAIVLIGISAALLAPFAEAALETVTEPYRQEEDINDMAKELYCSLIPYRYFDEASIESWISQYEGGNAYLQTAAYEYAEAIQTIIAQHWREIGMEATQTEIAMFLLRYEYDPFFDYTSLPCTPVIPPGAEQIVYDFTIDEQGWVPQSWQAGDHEPGQGWVATPYDGTWAYIAVEITWAANHTVTYAEVLYNLSDNGPGTYVPYWQYKGGPSETRDPSPEGTNLVWNFNAPGGGVSTNGIVLNLPVALAGTALLKRVSIIFDGDAPPAP